MTPQSQAAQKVYDAATQFEALLHYSDGDRWSSQESAGWLRQAQTKIEAAIKHLDSIPSQPDR